MFVVIALRYVFAEKVPGQSVETDILLGIARVALQHPAAGMIKGYRAGMEGITAEIGAGLVAGSRFRYGGFLADFVRVNAGRADCCGRAGLVAEICPMCSIATCVQCVLRPHGVPSARAWFAGVVSPMCQCLFDDDGAMRPTSRGAECMLDDGSGRLRPVFHTWPSA